ncbi:ABC-F type ribosomal protection protein [Hazenella sp. IB182357]|uniref:ABC-F type ribosomal protection protein n=1 Tax=Polycladospora coralii TaxID=2771432 RepID=A0A926N9K4_9BACL|nr:ABC-F type ribosomal protection protein [Polycladospora coralii]MBD1371907.1 ABC-F type ribosomal protection protein [Polycladospora coralii]
MIICSCQSLKKMVSTDWVLNGIQVDINKEARIGLVGANGSGKTTFLKCLAGLEQPDSGDIFVRKQVKVGYLAQIPRHFFHLTVKEVLEQPFSHLLEMEKQMNEISMQMSQTGLDENELERLLQKWDRLRQQFEAADGYQIESRINQVAAGLGIPQTMWMHAFQQLSGGEKTKVGLATVLLSQPDLLLLDEPTNHLDLPAVEWLESFLKNYRGAVLIVSHDRYFLDEVTTETWDLEDGEIISYPVPYTIYTKQKEERLLNEYAAYQEQEKKIKKMKETIKKLKEWANQANPPNAGLHRRAKSMEKALARIDRLKRPQLNRKKINLNLQVQERSGNDVIQAKGIGKMVDDRILFSHSDLHIRYQDRCGIVGANGSGKSTLFRIIQNEQTLDEGSLRIGANVRIGYLSQNGYEGNAEQTVIEAFRDEVAVSVAEARHILARFLFYGYAVFKKVKHLSGGEQMRLRLAQLMHQDINLLLLDEPTNHLDIDSREALEEAIMDFSGTIIAISHDRYFLNQCFEKIYWLENEAFTHYPGHFDWAKEVRSRR